MESNEGAFSPGNITISFLPLSHVAGQVRHYIVICILISSVNLTLSTQVGDIYVSLLAALHVHIAQPDALKVNCYSYCVSFQCFH